MKVRIFAMMLALALLCGALAGCSSKQEAAESPIESSAPAEAEVSSAEEAETPSIEDAGTIEEAAPDQQPDQQDEEPAVVEDEEFDVLKILEDVDTSACPIQFPLPEKETLTVWMSVPDRLMQDMEGGMEAHSSFLAFENATNVHIDWTQVTSTLAATQFNLMCVSGEYTDMIINASSMYTTGMDAAVDDEVYLPLNDYLEEYAPRYWKIVNADQDIYNSVITDNGNFVQMVGFTDKLAETENGLVIRSDFLDAVGMEAPVTYDDYYDVLTAFKTELELEQPIFIPASVAITGEYLVGGYGVAGKLYSMPMSSDPWYQVDGQIRYGAVQDEYLEFITMMNKWYSEGLFDKDFVSNNSRDSNTDLACGDEIGIFFLEGMGINSLESTAKDNPNWAIEAITDPVKEEGDIVHFNTESSWVSGGGVVLTTGCTNPELCVAWLDYWFSYDGQLAANYGIEGESYEFNEDGEPRYTELALTGNNRQVKYTNSNIPTVTYRDAVKYTYSEFRQNAPAIWGSNRDSAYSLPTNMSLTQEENEEYARIISDIHTYAEENIIKFVIGEIPLTQFEEFKDQIYSMNLDRCIEIYQTALDRYYGR